MRRLRTARSPFGRALQADQRWLPGAQAARVGLLAVTLACFPAMASIASAQTVITDFFDMEGGTNGQVVTPALAASTTIGTNGVWTTGSSSTSQLKVSTTRVRPPRGDIRIGSTTLPNGPSTKSWVKKVTSSGPEYVDYVIKNPRPLKVSVGMFMYWSSAGDSWRGDWYDYYDLFTLTGTGGINYLVLSVQTLGGTDGTPLSFNIHTDPSPCNSGVELFQGGVDKWYWITMLYDYSGTTRNALMEIYDATTWVRLGAKSCALPSVAAASEGLWRISIGQFDEHGNPPHNSDFYMDDLMVDVTGSFPILPKPGATAPPPAAPTGLRIGP